MLLFAPRLSRARPPASRQRSPSAFANQRLTTMSAPQRSSGDCGPERLNSRLNPSPLEFAARGNAPLKALLRDALPQCGRPYAHGFIHCMNHIATLRASTSSIPITPRFPAIGAEALALLTSIFLSLASNRAAWRHVLEDRAWDDPATWVFGACMFVALTAFQFVPLALVMTRRSARYVIAVVLVVSTFAGAAHRDLQRLPRPRHVCATCCIPTSRKRAGLCAPPTCCCTWSGRRPCQLRCYGGCGSSSGRGAARWCSTPPPQLRWRSRCWRLCWLVLVPGRGGHRPATTASGGSW